MNNSECLFIPFGDRLRLFIKIMAVSGNIKSRINLKVLSFIIIARLAPSEEPAKAATMQKIALFI